MLSTIDVSFQVTFFNTPENDNFSTSGEVDLLNIARYSFHDTVNIFVVKFATFYSVRFPGSKRGVTFTEIFSTEIISKILPN